MTVGAYVQVEAAKTVATEGVTAALENDGGWFVGADARADNVLEEFGVRMVVNAVIQRNIKRVMGARVRVGFWASGVQTTGAGEVNCFLVFVEGKGHDAIGGPEGLLNAVAMVDVDVNVENTRVIEE